MFESSSRIMELIRPRQGWLSGRYAAPPVEQVWRVAKRTEDDDLFFRGRRQIIRLSHGLFIVSEGGEPKHY
jgi:hypothetical protein